MPRSPKRQKPGATNARAMKLCADYIRLVQRFGVTMRDFNTVTNPVVRHVNRVYGYDAWGSGMDAYALERDARYRRGLANAARELRALRRA